MPDEPGNAPDRLRAADVHVLQMPLIRPHASRKQRSLLQLIRGYPRQIRSLRRLILEQRYDVVEVHGLLHIDGAVAGRLAGRGVVWQLIDTRPPVTLRWLVMPIVLALADVIMTTGEAVAAEYPGIRRRPERLVTFVPPVRSVQRDDETTAAIRLRTREKLSVADSAILIVSIGNLNQQKAFEDLLEAVAVSRSGRRVLELRVRGATQVGHEAYVSSLHQRAQALGFSPDTVSALEEGVTVSDLMISADIFALSSRAKSEGLPTVVLEAMSAARALVTTDVGSVAEVVRDGSCGLVVPPGDPEKLASALATLINSPEERERLGRAARIVANKVADPDAFAALQWKTYRLAERRRRHSIA